MVIWVRYVFLAMLLGAPPIATYFLFRSAKVQTELVTETRAPEPKAQTTTVTAPQRVRRSVASQSNDYLAFNPEGNLLAVYVSGGDFQLIDLKNQQFVWTGYVGTCWLASVKFDERNQRILIGDYVGSMDWRDRPPPVRTWARVIALADGKYQLEEAEIDEAILDYSRKSVVWSENELSGFTPNVPMLFADGRGYRFVAPSADGTEIAVPGAPLAECRIYRSKQLVFTIQTDGAAVAARFSPDSQKLAILHADGSVGIWQRGQKDEWNKTLRFAVP